MFPATVVEKNQNTILYSITSSLISCRLWDNMKKYDRSRQPTDNMIECMRFKWWIRETTDSHTLGIFNNYCFSTETVVTRTSLNVTLYVVLFSLRFVYTWLYRNILVRGRDPNNNFIILPILLTRQYICILYKNTWNLYNTFYTAYLQNNLQF